MQSATTLTVVRHDDTRVQFEDVRYSINRSGIRIAHADGAETVIAGNDYLTTHATQQHSAN